MLLNYRKYGQGHPLLILHGLYGSSDNWITIAKGLATHFEVYLLDQRNHGNSPHSPIHTYGSMREDLHEFMDHYHLEKAVILGHSMGGKTAMIFAAQYPERVTNLIVVDIAPKNYSELQQHTLTSIDHSKIVDLMLHFNFAGLASRSQIDDLLSKQLPDIKIRQFLLKNLKRLPDRSFTWKLNIRAIAKHLKEIMDGIERDTFSQKQHITEFPVLFIRGENSGYITEEDHKVIRSIFPYAEITTIPRSGHWVHAQQPSLLIKTIEYFTL